MNIGRKIATLSYALGTKQLRQVESVRDLGICVQGNLKTTEHTAHARKRGLRMLWMMKRAFTSWSPVIFRKLHTALIRPAMEYGAPAYYPITLSEANSLKYVQRLGLRMVPQLRGLTHEQRCAALHLTTLSYRRNRADLLMMFRVLELNELPCLRRFFGVFVQRSNRGHPFRLRVQRTDGLPHKYRLSRRAIKVWNQLPSAVFETMTLANFEEKGMFV